MLMSIPFGQIITSCSMGHSPFWINVWFCWINTERELWVLMALNSHLQRLQRLKTFKDLYYPNEKLRFSTSVSFSCVLYCAFRSPLCLSQAEMLSTPHLVMPMLPIMISRDWVALTQRLSSLIAQLIYLAGNVSLLAFTIWQ